MFLAFVISLVGCNRQEKSDTSAKDASSTKCDVVSASVVSCFEWSNLPEGSLDVVKTACDEMKGSLTDKEKCSRKNNVGGCTQGKSDQLVMYSYSPNYETAKVKNLCDSQGERYIAT